MNVSVLYCWQLDGNIAFSMRFCFITSSKLKLKLESQTLGYFKQLEQLSINHKKVRKVSSNFISFRKNKPIQKSFICTGLIVRSSKQN